MADYIKKPTPYEEIVKRQLDRIGIYSSETPTYSKEGNTECMIITNLEQQIGVMEAMLSKQLKKEYRDKLKKLKKEMEKTPPTNRFQEKYKHHYKYLISKLALLVEVMNRVGMGMEIEEEMEI